MEKKYSFICQAANISQTGNLNVLGIFDGMNVHQFPFIGSFCYVANLSAHRSEMGPHSFRLMFIDDDGNNIIPQLSGNIIFTNENPNSNIIVNFQPQFTKAGSYYIDLIVDNQHICTETLTVRQQ